MITLGLGCVWLITANVLAILPSRDNHWMRAYGLLAVGVPLLAVIFYVNGVWFGLAFLIAGMSVLRLPVVYVMRRVRGLFAGKTG